MRLHAGENQSQRHYVWLSIRMYRPSLRMQYLKMLWGILDWILNCNPKFITKKFSFLFVCLLFAFQMNATRQKHTDNHKFILQTTANIVSLLSPLVSLKLHIISLHLKLKLSICCFQISRESTLHPVYVWQLLQLSQFYYQLYRIMMTQTSEQCWIRKITTDLKIRTDFRHWISDY